MECLLNLRNLPHASRPLIPTKVATVLTFNRRFILWGLYSHINENMHYLLLLFLANFAQHYVYDIQLHC